ncbi:MAG: peptidylprolyl isomerase fpr4 [Trizodia sp. TS-e1964]|nr:MAG: peptidylprolyl isomerase fpr4 [Trizodia sp. TS-e1964]
MSSLIPIAVYGLEVPAGDIETQAAPDFPSTFRITMAAIDPNAKAKGIVNGDGAEVFRSTLKVIRRSMDNNDELDSSDLSSDEEDDFEINGGPSDLTKHKSAKKAAKANVLKKLLEDQADNMDIDAPSGANGSHIAVDKGKDRATNHEDSDEDLSTEEFVLCTLDPSKGYQQPLDITIGQDEEVSFKVTGTHAIFLTGNYMVPADDESSDSDEGGMGYDLSPYDDELALSGESDDLDDLDDPRFTEVATDSEEEDTVAPTLVKKGISNKKDLKGKNKRTAEDLDDGLDDIIAKSLKPDASGADSKVGETKLSKRELKKLKNNAGASVPVENASSDPKPAAGKPLKEEKKVQFAKTLEQGSAKEQLKAAKAEAAKKVGSKKEENGDGNQENKHKATIGIKIVNEVSIDDKVLGKGPAAKAGNRVEMRYIGKFADGKVFDSNKKGKPFGFVLGSGEVIKGWDIGVAGMSVGGERRLIIPSKLAYGAKGTAGIPGNSNLTFDIKLLAIK